MITENLLAQIPESESRATLEVLLRAGVFRAGLEKIRSNKDLAKKIADMCSSVHVCRTRILYPPEFQPRSIPEQLDALRKFQAFAELDASWVLNEAQSWYEGLKLPEGVEQPLVYVWYESVGGYHNALDLVLSAIAGERKFHNYRTGKLTPEHLRQVEATREAELKLKADQPGDFLVVPSQVGARWGGYSVKEARELFDTDEFGHGSVATACLVYTHPKRIVNWGSLHANCPGDTFSAQCNICSNDIAPFFDSGRGQVCFDGSEAVSADKRYGSVSGFLTQ